MIVGTWVNDNWWGGPSVRWAGSSGDFLPTAPPSEKATARQDQAGQPGTHDGTEWLEVKGQWLIIECDDVRVCVTDFIALPQRTVAFLSCRLYGKKFSQQPMPDR